MSISANSATKIEGGGNVTNPTFNNNEKKFRLNRKLFGLTYSCPKNLSAISIDLEMIREFLEGIGKCYYIISEEEHKDGKLHYHCYVDYFKKIDSKNERFFDLNGIHPKIEKINKKENWCDYIRKDNNFITNMDEEIIPTKYTIDIKLYDWELRICKEILDTKPNDRCLWNIVGKEGCEGKTTFQKWIYLNYRRVLCLSGKATDMKYAIVEYKNKNGYVPKIILINVPRSNLDFISFTGIEEIKDMFFFSGKYEGGMICEPNPHVLIFSNENIDTEGDKMSQDRWRFMYIEKTVANPIVDGPIDEFVNKSAL